MYNLIKLIQLRKRSILDKTNASATLVCALGNGDDGETIAFNPEDDTLYHGSGFEDLIFEKIIDTSINPCIISLPITLSGDTYEEQILLTYLPSEEVFLSADFDGVLSTITDVGVITNVGLLEHTATGLAVVGTEVILCHDDEKTKTFSADKVKQINRHLKHGDTLGSCVVTPDDDDDDD